MDIMPRNARESLKKKKNCLKNIMACPIIQKVQYKTKNYQTDRIIFFGVKNFAT